MELPGSGNRLSARSRLRLERRQAIADYVLQHGVATPQELTEVTGASLMTVHRDLDELARRGLIRKFHGGVSAQPSSVFESSSDYRLNVQAEDKEALASAAAQRIESGMSVMLDTSSTNVFLARRFAEQELMQLTVITNYVPILQTLRDCEGLRVIMIGGDFNRNYDSFFGMDAVAMTESLRVDVAILSTSAMTAAETFHQDEDIVTMKRAMMASADSRLLLMDRTKLRRVALHRLAPTEDFDELLLADPEDPEFVRDVSKKVRTEVVPVESGGRGA